MNRISRSIGIEPSERFREQLLTWSRKHEEVIWLDSNTSYLENPQKYSSFDAALAVGAHKKISLEQQNAFGALSSFIKERKDYLFGYLSYDLKNEIEDLESANPDHLSFPDLYFFQPEKLFFLKGNVLEMSYLPSCASEMDQDLNDITDLQDPEPASKQVPQIKPRISRRDYFQKMEQILEHIHRGDIYEVNFCQEFYADECRIDPISVYRKLNRISRAPFACFLKIPDRYMICSSPERFVRKEGSKLISQPIKGTAKRQSSRELDEQAIRQLMSDPKERAENVMIVDLVRNDLSKSALKGSVSVDELCGVYTFRQVHQLISTVTSSVAENADPVKLISDLFPMGSMTGAPKISAMQIIEELEDTKRGLFSGAVGYFTPELDFDFNVVIRSILYNEQRGYLSLSAGSAVTASSVIAREYEECLIKAKALIQALQ